MDTADNLIGTEKSQLVAEERNCTERGALILEYRDETDETGGGSN